MFKALDVHEAYKKMLRDVFYEYEYESNPRGMNTREILDYQIRILKPKSEAIITSDTKRNKIIKNYTEKELQWYITGDRRAESAPTKFWLTIADDDGLINSNYGHLALYDDSENGISPYAWAFNCLEEDKDSRKAIIRFNKPKHCLNNSKDFVCTMYLIFHIRDNKLNASVKMRSADLFTGPVYDLPWFIYLQESLYKDLKEVYNDLEMGYFTFNADSLHLYERNFDKIEDMIR